MAGRTFVNGKELITVEDLVTTDDVTVGDDLSVGDDSTFTDDVDIGGTLTMSGADGAIVAEAAVAQTTPVLSIKQSPTGATTNSIVIIEADGANWSGGECLKLIADDGSITPFIVDNGSGTVAYVTRAGQVVGSSFATGGDLTLNAGGSIVSTANGNITLAPNGAGIVHSDANVELDGGNGSLQTAGSITEEVTIAVAAGAAGVATSGNLAPANAYIKEVLSYVTQAPGGGATTLDIGRTNGGNLDEAADGTGVAATTTTMANNDGDGNTTFPVWEAGADTLTLTTDANVTVSDMKVRVTVFYEEYTAHTS